MTEFKIIKSVVKSRARPVLSILVPYYKDNPAELVTALLKECEPLKSVEILLYDDGTNDPDLNRGISALAKSASTPVQVMIANDNRGRSEARNILQKAARGDWVLFLDADMRPETDHFVSDYLALIREDAADVIFGGFTVPHSTHNPDTELHRVFSETSDCLTLAQRQACGPQYVASSNLCVRKVVLESEPFDTEFKGWGWEDSEWAARVNQKFSLRHADIPALHLGLESTDTLLRRFKDSGPNYVRFTTKHPDIAKTLTLYRMSQKLRRIPGQKLMRPVLRGVVKFQHGPVKMRLLALKLWRASWYAEAFA